IGRELRADAASFLARGVPRRTGDPRGVEGGGRRYVAAQPFRAAGRLLIERVHGGGVVTNQPEVVGLRGEPNEPLDRQRAEREQARRLLMAPIGFSTVRVADVGELRLFNTVAQEGGTTPAVVGVGEPLEPVERAQRGVARTFVV